VKRVNFSADAVESVTFLASDMEISYTSNNGSVTFSMGDMKSGNLRVAQGHSKSLGLSCNRKILLWQQFLGWKP